MATAVFAVTGGRVTAFFVSLLLLCSCAVVPACDEKAGAKTAKVKLGGRAFFLELALDPQTRFRGLSERTHIDPDGGMLFVMPDREVSVLGFVMRDCPIPIDIVYLDPGGRITAWHEMTPEPPRDPARAEGTPQDPNNVPYNSRLKQYTSKFPAQFVLELKGGTVKTLSLKEGEKVDLDIEGLRKMAR